MVFRSAWAVMVLAGLAFTAGSCGAYPDREFKSSDASTGAAGTTGGAGGSSGTSGSGGASGSATGTGGGDASVVVVDAAKDSTPADVKADVDRQICKLPGAHPGLDCRCADGTVDNEFTENLVGCADSPDFGTTWAMRGQACGTGCMVANALSGCPPPGTAMRSPVSTIGSKTISS